MNEGRLEEDELLERAVQREGLDDFGAPGFRAPLRTLIEEVNTADDLSGAVLGRAAEVIVDLLATRLRFVADRKRHPIDEEMVEQPIFITGQARSGTTLMHCLLSEDPANRSPRFWEVARPSPPVGLIESEDPRIAQGNADMQDFLERMKNGLAAHPYWDAAGMMPLECTRLTTLDFRNMSAMAFWRLPIAKGWVLSRDTRAHYAFHRMMLQTLQYGSPKRRWVLKGAAHYSQLASLLECYPDARILWMHRDPVTAVASRLELEAVMAEGITGNPVDRYERASRLLSVVQDQLHAVLGDPLLEDPRVFHIRFDEWVRDPLARIAQLYRYFGLPLEPEAEGNMKRWLDDPRNRSDRYGRFQYSIEPFGMSADEMDEIFRPYRERFEIPRENRGL